MVSTQRIPAERLQEFDLHAGDTLRVIAVMDATLLIQINRADADTDVPAKARAWLESARGSVDLQPGETADDLRRAYYASKFGIAS